MGAVERRRWCERASEVGRVRGFRHVARSGRIRRDSAFEERLLAKLILNPVRCLRHASTTTGLLVACRPRGRRVLSHVETLAFEHVPRIDMPTLDAESLSRQLRRSSRSPTPRRANTVAKLDEVGEVHHLSDHIACPSITQMCVAHLRQQPSPDPSWERVAPGQRHRQRCCRPAVEFAGGRAFRAVGWKITAREMQPIATCTGSLTRSVMSSHLVRERAP